ncbi:MAG: tetratricopeptide repeat protein [Candidatus Poribacteria bacterium]|nr:tetratricopeptide repeat protein [Candidatus Poribacteria bacterium]
MYNTNGSSELTKLIFKNSANEEKLKQLLISNYSEADLTAYLRSKDPLLGRAAGFALRLIGSPEVIPALVEALKDADRGTRFNAEYALWEIWSHSGDDAVDAMLEDGKNLLKNEAYQQAVECFTTVIETNPDFAEGYNQRAIAYFMLEEWSQSIRDCKRTVALNPNHFGAFAGMGHVYVRLGKLDEALEAYKQALVINPNLISIAEAVLRLRDQIEGKRG